MIFVYDNADVYSPVFCRWIPSSFSVEDGKIQLIGKPGTIKGGKVIDLKGKKVIPGLIDAHIHIESTLLTPSEFGKIAVLHGVTSVIADPHEIGNAAGTSGIDFMIEDAKNSPSDIFFMIPSCVPAVNTDIGFAVIDSKQIAEYKNNPSVIGLGEMMNIPGVLSDDPEVCAKLKLFSHADGHCPKLSGDDLCRYIAHGIKTDHECSSADEAEEKLERGMYVFLREGGAAKNVSELAEAVTPCSASHCCFATDDKHADEILKEGSVDNCIRTALKSGMPLELALRCATLSAAECFNLNDRGIIAPGKIADFCILSDSDEFEIAETYKNGVLITPESFNKASITKLNSPEFKCKIPTAEDLVIPDGNLRVIGIIEGEIITENLTMKKDEPGLSKIVCADRYRAEGFGIGLVKGLGIKRGAIAVSIAHDAHNIIAAGNTDEEIIAAIDNVCSAGGGFCVVCDGNTAVLPLPYGGIMTPEPYEKLCENLKILNSALEKTGAVKNAFMHLSFLSLTVIPHLKITPRGLFDADSFCDVSLKI